jgi:hypothetical protein
MTPTITLVEAKATAQRYQGTTDGSTTVRSGVASAGAGGASVLILPKSSEPRRKSQTECLAETGTHQVGSGPDRQLRQLQVFC